MYGLDALRFILRYRQGEVDDSDLEVFASNFGRIGYEPYLVTATATDENGTYTSNTLPVVDPPPPEDYKTAETAPEPSYETATPELTYSVYGLSEMKSQAWISLNELHWQPDQWRDELYDRSAFDPAPRYYDRGEWKAYEMTALNMDEGLTYTSSNQPEYYRPAVAFSQKGFSLEKATDEKHDLVASTVSNSADKPGWPKPSRTPEPEETWQDDQWWDGRFVRKTYDFRTWSADSDQSLIDLSGEYHDRDFDSERWVQRAKRGSRDSWVESFVSDLANHDEDEGPSSDIRIVLTESGEFDRS